MIAVDTNVLVYAHRQDSPYHTKSVEKIENLLAGMSGWAIPYPCIHEFIAVVTNARIFKDPTPITTAFDTIRSWQQGQNLHFLSEGSPDYLDILEAQTRNTHLSGAKVHDARIAAICIYHGISELWTCDRDFSLFPKLKTFNPVI